MSDVIIRLKKDSTLMGHMATLSPDGRYLASTQVSRLVIRDLHHIAQILYTHQCLDKIEKLEFSPDSELILCGLYARSAIQVFSVKNSEWKCRINEGVAGVISTCWAPDSRHIFAESDFGICLSVWALSEEKHSVISMPKPYHKGFKSQFIAFSEASDIFAVAHRIELQDHIGLYSLGSVVRELNRFKARSNDIAVIQFLPKDTHIITMDSPLTYMCCVYTPKGELLIMYEAYQNALGLRTIVCYSNLKPPDQLAEEIEGEDNVYAIENPLETSRCFVALGSYDGKVRLMTMYTWLVAYELPLTHPRELNSAMCPEGFKTKVEVSSHDFLGMGKNLKESLFEGDGGLFGGLNLNNDLLVTAAENMDERVVYVERMIKSLPRLVLDARGSTKSAHAPPTCGVNWIGWSADGRYLGATEESYPRCLWIWEAGVARLVDLMVQLESITCAQWRPMVEQDGIKSRENVLAFCCGTPILYFWSDVRGLFKRDNLFASNEHNIFNFHSLRWSKSGKMILLKGKESHAICHFAPNESVTTA